MKFDVNKVFTALNADELKMGDKVILADDISTLKTLVDREENIVIIDHIGDEDVACRFSYFWKENDEEYAHALAYLVRRKEEKKFRPYKDTDEMITDYKRRFNVACPDYELPSIWLNYKFSATKNVPQIVEYGKTRVYLSNLRECVYCNDLFAKYEYLDGTPCGMEE